MPVVLAANIDNGGILLSLFLILASAKILAELFERLKQPAVVGEILAGVLIGPSVLGWVEPSKLIEVLAEIGVIFLLFNVGLETKPQSILKVGRKAIMVGVLGIILPFVAGYWISVLWFGSTVEALFIGAALVATSVGITARVLGSLGLLDSEAARIILGAAVIDDILGLLILSVVSGVSKGELNYLALAGTTSSAVIFTAGVAVLGAVLITRLAPRIRSLHISNPFFNFGLLLCLGLSVAAMYMQVAAIIGAFLAGMALSEATEGNVKMRKLTSGVTEFLVPFFLVNIGMQLNLQIFADSSVVGFAVLITLVAIVTKLVGCGIGAYGSGWRFSAQVGIGMVPRGEVGIVVAQIGLSLAAISDKVFGSVLFMAIATTLIAPPFIKMLFTRTDVDEDIHLSDIVSRIG
ncbi:MAG: cation:proton antiporter [Pyrinomonadaceae bacterium]|nr:cation:proton antiporter [Pyrinomonadaceae bacterium]